MWKGDQFAEQVRDREVEEEVGGRDSILNVFQKSHGWDLLMDSMWEVKQRSEGWLQGAGLTVVK